MAGICDLAFTTARICGSLTIQAHEQLENIREAGKSSRKEPKGLFANCWGGWTSEQDVSRVRVCRGRKGQKERRKEMYLYLGSTGVHSG